MDDTIDWVVRSNYTARRIAQDSTEDAVLIIDKMVAEERAGGDNRLSLEFLRKVRDDVSAYLKGPVAITKLSVLVPVELFGLTHGFKLPDKDIRLLGIGRHRFFLFHSAMGVAVLSYLYRRWLEEGSNDILSRCGHKVAGALLGSYALGVGIHLMTDVFQPKAVIFLSWVASQGTLVDEHLVIGQLALNLQDKP